MGIIRFFSIKDPTFAFAEIDLDKYPNATIPNLKDQICLDKDLLIDKTVDFDYYEITNRWISYHLNSKNKLVMVIDLTVEGFYIE